MCKKMNSSEKEMFLNRISQFIQNEWDNVDGSDDEMVEKRMVVEMDEKMLERLKEIMEMI